MAYNYRHAVCEDVKDYILGEYFEGENIDLESMERFSDVYDFEEYLNDTLFNEDRVTGNLSGSYTMSTYYAEENLSHNFHLIEEAAGYFGIEPTIRAGYECGAEWWDVTIRCYLLGEAIHEVIHELGIDDFFDEREAV